MALQPTTRRAEIGLERRARMRRRLLEAAARVMANEGDNATIDTFIRAAGVARGTFYNHFKTREELLDALWTSIGHDPFLEIQNACKDLADPVERFAAVTRLVLLRAAQDPTWGWLILALSAEEATLNDDLRGYPRPDLTAGAAAGRFRYESEASATDLVVGTMRAGLRALLHEGRDANYAQALCKMMLQALGINRIEATRISALSLPDVPGKVRHLGQSAFRGGKICRSTMSLPNNSSRNEAAEENHAQHSSRRRASKGGPFLVEPITLDDPRETEVLIRIAGVGMCHTDLVVRDQYFPTPLPAVLGHEGAGVVEKVGARVTKVTEGDAVVLSFASCGVCANCQSGRYGYCPDLYGRNFSGGRPDGSSPCCDAHGSRVSSYFFAQSSFGEYAIATDSDSDFSDK